MKQNAPLSLPLWIIQSPDTPNFPRLRRWCTRSRNFPMKSARCRIFWFPCGPTPCGKRLLSNCSARWRDTQGPSSNGQSTHISQDWLLHYIFLRVYCSSVTLEKVQNVSFDRHSFNPVFSVVRSHHSANFRCYLTLNWWKDDQGGVVALTHIDLKCEYLTECWLVAGIKDTCQSTHSALQGSTRSKTSMESTVWLLAGTANTVPES